MRHRRLDGLFQGHLLIDAFQATKTCKIELMNPHAAVLADLEKIESDAERGIEAIRCLVARDPGRNTVAPPAPIRKAKEGRPSATIIKLLVADRGSESARNAVVARLAAAKKSKPKKAAA